MSANRQLSRFVRDALANGTSRSEIAAVLAQSGWSAPEVAEALDAWAETPFSPPVPRPQAAVSAKDFFIYALTFGVLLFGASYFVQLLHGLIDWAVDPDGLGPSYSLRWSVAVLIVTVPVYAVLSLRDRRALAANPALYRSAIRKWLIYVTLLFAAAVLLSDMAAVINAFLSGEVTIQFLAKAVVVALVAGGIFLYYRADARKSEAA
ncbi:hypothetical protein SAMN04488523_11266 [Sulfitobacter brevis]|uniref:DUF5671 domain-containing protein n=1 Tax=Sulfitobacter brevis TaxID=74348 RepID=A0A1I2EJD8_9RHOB|nr:DUF5671 domain-containing protein [Sulfitobacter brevis]SFE92636.1 hypothetical protein SAMN04488523_11266 [Sulfitobacter brevis]